MTPTTVICRVPWPLPRPRPSVYPTGSIGARPPSVRDKPARANTGYWLAAPSIRVTTRCRARPTVHTCPPGAYRTARVNQVDISIKRTFRIKEKLSLEPTFQLFNLLNSNAADHAVDSGSGFHERLRHGAVPDASQCSGAGSPCARMRNAASVEIFPPLPIPG